MLSKRSIVMITLFTLSVLVITFIFFALHRGIQLDSLKFRGYKIEKLYLKLDKGLILKARLFQLPETSGQADLSLLPDTLKTMHRILRGVRSIDLETLRIGRQSFHLLYRDRIFYLNSPTLEVAGMLYDRGSYMQMQIPLLRLPKKRISLSGELHYRYQTGDIDFEGDYDVPDLAGKLRVRKTGERIEFRITSMRTGSLRRLLRLLRMNPKAEEWLKKRIAAHAYRLEYLEGIGRFDRQSEEFIPEISSLRGVLRLQKPTIRFHDGLAPIRAESARVILQDASLYFLLEHPHYGRHSIEGSSAALYGLDDPKRLMVGLRIHYRGRLDWSMLKILHAYNVPIDLGQRSGTVNARVDLDVPLSGGRIKSRGSADFSAGVLEYGKRQVRIGGGKILFSSKTVILRHLLIDETKFKALIDGRIGLLDRQARLRITLRKLKWQGVGGALVIQNLTLPLQIHWSGKSWEAELPTLRTTVVRNTNGMIRADLKDLALWHRWLRGLYALAEGGHLRIESPDGRRIDLSGTLLWKGSFLYDRNGFVTSLPFHAKIDGSASLVEALGDRILYRQKKGVLKLHDINIDARRLLALAKALSANGSKSVSKRLTVEAERSVIRYGLYVLPADRYRLLLHGEDLDFDAVLGKDRLTLKKHGNRLIVDARRIDDRMLHPLIHFTGLVGGRYTLHAEGDLTQKRFHGEIIIEGGVVKNFKAMNDLMALFNTVPALVAFSDPGFSRVGFELRRGRIVFTLQQETLTLNSILLQGRSSTIAGKGTIRLDNGKLDLDLAVRTARELGKTLGQIPVVGYILFGKDKSLTVGVHVDGTLEHPRVHTNPLGEALLYPLELLKRTFQTPAQLASPVQNSLPPSKQKKVKSSDGNISTSRGEMF